MEKVIYNINTSKLVVLNEYNKIIPNLVLDKYIIDEIDFSTLPSNIFSNISLYLGNEYELYNFDYQYVYSLLINKDIYLDKDSNEYKDKDGEWLYNYDLNKDIYFDKELNEYKDKDGKCLYSYDLKNETLWLSYNRIILVLITKYGFNWQIARQLCKGILKEHYKWNVVITSDSFWQW